MRYRLTTRPQHEEYTGDSLEQLSQHLEIVQRQPYIQVWIDKDDGRSFGAFFNRTVALVAWFNDDGHSAQTFNPACDIQDEVQEIYLENGQLDEYPECYCIAKQEGIRSLFHFYEQGKRPDWLNWQDN
jgi:hypothetical protein